MARSQRSDRSSCWLPGRETTAATRLRVRRSFEAAAMNRWSCFGRGNELADRLPRQPGSERWMLACPCVPSDRVRRASWIVMALWHRPKRPLDGAYSDAAVRVCGHARPAQAYWRSMYPAVFDADTGALVGDVAVAADHTLTFIASRVAGPDDWPGADYVGHRIWPSLGLV